MRGFCADKGRVQKPLSDVYKEALFARVMVALNKAEREGIIIKNPGKDIDHKLKPHAKESTRCYLTLEEVKKIIDTPYWPKNDVKPAFLFCCFSGLRHSDLLKLTWGEIKQTADGQYQIETMMKRPSTVSQSLSPRTHYHSCRNEEKRKTATAYFPTFLTNPVMRMPGSRPSFATQASTRKSHSTSAVTPLQPSH